MLYHLENKMNNNAVNIKDVNGNIIGSGISGNANIIGKEVQYIVKNNVFHFEEPNKEIIELLKRSVQNLDETALKKNEIQSIQSLLTQIVEIIRDIDEKFGTHTEEVAIGDLRVSRTKLLLNKSTIEETKKPQEAVIDVTPHLNSEVVNKIRSFLLAYRKLGQTISLTEIWLSPNRGNLRELLNLFQDNANEYGLSEMDRTQIDKSIVFINVRVPKLQERNESLSKIEEELTTEYMKCKTFFTRLVPDNEVRSNETDISLTSQISVLKTQNTIRIVQEFYDVVDYMLTLKEATNSLVHSYQAKETIKTLESGIMKTIEGFFEKTTKDLIQKFNLLIDDIKQSHPAIWNKISDTHLKLKNEIDRLCSYFTFNTNNIMQDLKETLDGILEIMRTELRKLWTLSVKDIIEASILSVES